MAERIPRAQERYSVELPGVEYFTRLVACQQGLSTRGGAEAVGRATTTTVVRSIVLIIAADLFVTALLYLRG